MGYTTHMTTKNTIPEIVAKAVALDFKSFHTVTKTRENTYMASAGNLTIYYIVNPEQTEIIDIQVD